MSRNRLRLTIYAVSALLAAVGGVGIAAAATTPAATTAAAEPAAGPPVEIAPQAAPPRVGAAPAPKKAQVAVPKKQKAQAVGDLKVAPYVDMGLSGRPTLAKFAADGGVKGFTLAFVNSVGCKASWFNAFDPREKAFRDEIDELRAAGGDVKISFGGATGIELAIACTDVAALTKEYQAVIDAYDLTFMDMDIEGAAVADTASIARRSQALAAVQKANPGLKISLTLPVLPEGLTQDGVNVVKSAVDAGVDLDLVNIMAMDYQRAGQDYGDLAIQAAKSTKAQIEDLGLGFRQLGVTPMLGVNDDKGVFNQSDAADVLEFARDNDLGYLSFWEANRDRNACTGALFQCTNIPQQPLEFSKIFAAF